jgi:hypothetical protein
MTDSVTLYKNTKVATQSGKGKTDCWCIEFCPTERKKQNHLTGWYGSGDTLAHRKLFFETQEQAIEFCKQHDLQYEIQISYDKKITPKSYEDNFIKFR